MCDCCSSSVPSRVHVLRVTCYGDPPSLCCQIVQIVGYGTDPDTLIPFWILQNSWSADWGEQGRMSEDTTHSHTQQDTQTIAHGRITWHTRDHIDVLMHCCIWCCFFSRIPFGMNACGVSVERDDTDRSEIGCLLCCILRVICCRPTALSHLLFFSFVPPPPPFSCVCVTVLTS